MLKSTLQVHASRHQKTGRYRAIALSLYLSAVGTLAISTSEPVHAQAVPVDQFVNFESGHVHPLDMTPDATRLLAVNTANNTLEVFSIADDGRLTNTNSIPVGHDPVSVRVRSNSEAWVANVISDTVSIVDLDLGAVVRTLQTQDEPSDIVFAGNPLRAFVSAAERESVQIFDLDDLDSDPREIFLIGEQPRALAVSADGQTVFAAFFESGNQTTVISGNDFIATGGLNAPFSGSTVVQNDVRNPVGPYGGQVPVPNDGDTFNPPLNPALPPKTNTQSLVVKKQSDGRWLDDNDGDWTEIVSGGAGERMAGWDLQDRDVAIIDANSLSVSYQNTLGNILMAMSVNPASGEVYVVGTDATNHIRFEPNLKGTFMRHNVSRFLPGFGAADIIDLNPHLDYSRSSVTNPERLRSVGDPRAVAWRADGQTAYVSGMGSNNVIAIDAAGNRITEEPIEVGEGPTGIIVDETRGLAYVLNKFDAGISAIDMQSQQQISETRFFDPTPTVIKTGRRHLYNTITGSGNGTISCASCHVDGKWDRLAWDLGDPSGEMLDLNGIEFHPLKGLKTTQSLIDILSSGFPLHWRGDQLEFGDFHLAFENLKGREPVTEAAMREFEAFIGTTYYPPNPYRELSIRSTANLRDLIRGPGTSFQRFTMPTFTDNNAVGFWHEACGGCHNNHTGKGPSRSSFRASQYEDNENLAPDLRPLYKKLGFYYDSADSTVGFGLMSDGVVDTEFFKAQQSTDGYFFDYHGLLLGYSGGFTSWNPSNSAQIRPPHNSQSSHHAVGEQATINGNSGDSDRVARLRDLADDSGTLSRARMQQDDLGLVVHGILQGESRGFVYTGNNTYQSDTDGQLVSHSDLLNAAGANNDEPLTWTLVHDQVAQRLGVDRDADGIVNRDDIIDSDNDGVPDDQDAFPADPSESADFDGDGIGDNADTDDDNDSVPDDTDQLPNNPDESIDSDADGIGNNADTDDDGDGVEDTLDAFPLDFNETSDADGDGIGDNADNDADNDGIATLSEAGGVDFNITTDTVLMTPRGGSVTTLIDLSAQGANIGQRVRLSGLRSMGNFRDTTFNERGFELIVNDGEYSSGYVTTNSNQCTMQLVAPTVAADVTVIDIGAGVPGLRIESITTARTGTRCGGAQYQLDIDGAESFVADIDNDGIPNEQDLDSDNDGIADVVEAGLNDTDGDYLVDALSAQGSVTTLPDTDNDGIADVFDRESNNALNDGTAYDITATVFAAYDTNNDGRVSAADANGGVDANGNGVDDLFESPVTPPPEPPTTTPTVTPAPPTAIIIDGNVADWANAPTFPTDPVDVSGADNLLDLASVQLAHDAQQLYVRYDNHPPEAMQISWGYSTHLDTDANRETGFRGFSNEYPIGVDYVIEGQSIHRYIGTGTNWAWTAPEPLTSAIIDNSIEIALPLATIGNTRSIRFFLFANNTAVGGEQVDYYPDAAANGDAADETRSFAYLMDDATTPSPQEPPQPPATDIVSNSAGIVVDGALGDWQALQSFGADPDDVSGAGNVLDWREGWIAHDRDNFYIAWRNDDPAQLSWGNGIMIDADQNRATGFRGFSNEIPIGVDYLLEADVVHRYNGSGQDWNWVDGGSIAPAIAGNAVEIAVGRDVLNNTEAFDVFFFGNNVATQGNAKDFYPDAAGVTSAAANERYFSYAVNPTAVPVEPPVTAPQSIIVDGDLSDWPDNTRLGSDDPNDMSPPDTIDWKRAYATAAGDQIYLAYESHEAVSLNWGYAILIDTDNNAATGFRGFAAELPIGAEFIFEANELNRFTGATQSEWSWNSVGLNTLAIGGNAAEVALSRADLGNPTALNILLMGNNSAVGGSAVDFHPDSGVLNTVLPTDEPNLSAARDARSPQLIVGGGSFPLLACLWLLPLLVMRRLQAPRHLRFSAKALTMLMVSAVLLSACDSGGEGANSASANPFNTASNPNNVPQIDPQDNAGQPQANASFETTVAAVLDGAQVVPATDSTASGSVTVTLNSYTGALSGSVRHSVPEATSAVIYHDGNAIVLLGRIDDNVYRIPAGTALDAMQTEAFLNGRLYIQIHSNQYPQGAIRTQLVHRTSAG